MIAAIALSVVVLIASQYYFRSKYPKSKPDAGIQTSQPGAPAPAAAAPVNATARPSDEPATAPSSKAAPASKGMVQGTLQTLTIDSELYSATVSTEGATLRSFALKSYKDQSGKPLELIPQSPPEPFGYPWKIVTGDVEIDRRANAGVYKVVSLAGTVEPLDPGKPLALEYRDEKVSVTKTVTFTSHGYGVLLDVRLEAYGQPRDFRLAISPALVDFKAPDYDDFKERSTVARVGQSIEREYAPEEDLSYSGSIQWAGLSSKYFSAVWESAEGRDSVLFDHTQYKGLDDKGTEVDRHWVDAVIPSRGPHWTGTVYYGPNDFETLNSVRAGLGEVIDYGYFGFLVKPLLAALRLVNTRIGNWGWSIIALTFLISLALFPVRHKQMASMKKMQVLQPRVKEIQEKYKKLKKTDPKRQQMNVEVMNLYKENKVNPLGGCLPLLIQMPFLFAFYQMLNVSLELRGAPFALWIQDLSKHDPYYVSPILMGVLMVWQQKSMPSGVTDPAQARMMMMMPIVFTVMFLWISSGLVLYMLFSSVFAMAFQWISKRLDPSLRTEPPKQGLGVRG